jgi:phytoene desaturase
VTLYEKNERVGGKIDIVQKGEFRWDAGPSFFTDPQEFRRLFSDCGQNPQDYFTYFDLDEACRYLYSDVTVRGFDDSAKLAEELERAFAEPKENTLRYLSKSSAIFESAGRQFIDSRTPLSSILDLHNLASLRHIHPDLVFRSLHDVHQSYFSSPRTVQFFDRFATYVGADPMRAPAMLMTIPSLEHVGGAFQPKGGMRSLVDAAHKLALDSGVEIKTRSNITGIMIRAGKVGGICVGAQTLRHDIIVNAGDIATVYRWLGDGRFARHEKREHSLSAYVLYLGIKRFTKKQYLHTILFSDDYASEIDSLWRDNSAYHDPTIYINNTSYFESSHAPNGHENWFVMVNMPAGSTDETLVSVRAEILSKLSRHFGVDIKNHIVAEANSLTPRYLQSKYGAFRGSIYGLAANSLRGAYLRPPNKDERIEGLYHVGVTTHPGGGIPLALRSARNVSQMIG